MRSVRTPAAIAAVVLPLAVGLTGCVTTQQVATRARVVAARIRATDKPTLVTRPDPAIGVARPVVIHGTSAAALVVSLRNNSSRTLTDLPISVGIRTKSGHTTYLNASPGADYFASHVAAIGAHSATAWVLTTHRRLPAGRPFAIVGSPALASSASSTLPRIEASSREAGTPAPNVVVSIVSRSAVPQYDLPLYVLAVRDGRYVAAGEAALAHIGTNGTASKDVAVVGNLRHATLQAIAVPTIFS